MKNLIIEEKTRFIVTISLVLSFLIGSIPFAVFYGYSIFTGLAIGLLVGLFALFVTIASAHVFTNLSRKFAYKKTKTKVFGSVHVISFILKLVIIGGLYTIVGIFNNQFNIIAVLIGSGVPLIGLFGTEIGYLIKNRKKEFVSTTEVTW